MNKQKIILLAVSILALVGGIIFFTDNRDSESSIVLDPSDLPEKVGDSIEKDGYTITREEIYPSKVFSDAPIINIPPRPSSVDQKTYAFVKEKLEVALDMYSKSSDEKALLDIALYYNMLGRSDAAVNIWKFMNEKSPLMIQPVVNLAQHYMSVQNFVEAEKWFLKSIQNEPKMTQLYQDLFEIYKSQKRTDEAIKILEKGVSSNPTAYELDVSLARFYLELGNQTLAKTSYQSALKKAEAQKNEKVADSIREELNNLK